MASRADHVYSIPDFGFRNSKMITLPQSWRDMYTRQADTSPTSDQDTRRARSNLMQHCIEIACKCPAYVTFWARYWWWCIAYWCTCMLHSKSVIPLEHWFLDKSDMPSRYHKQAITLFTYHYNHGISRLKHQSSENIHRWSSQSIQTCISRKQRTAWSASLFVCSSVHTDPRIVRLSASRHHRRSVAHLSAPV